jgi:hypothetical protein
VEPIAALVRAVIAALMIEKPISRLAGPVARIRVTGRRAARTATCNPWVRRRFVSRLRETCFGLRRGGRGWSMWRE